jgi:hypothetical protein
VAPLGRKRNKFDSDSDLDFDDFQGFESESRPSESSSEFSSESLNLSGSFALKPPEAALKSSNLKTCEGSD